jgi:hypothetical protein
MVTAPPTQINTVASGGESVTVKGQGWGQCRTRGRGGHTGCEATRTDVCRACRGHELENAKMSSSNPKIKDDVHFVLCLFLSVSIPSRDTLVYKGFLGLTEGKRKNELIYF